MVNSVASRQVLVWSVPTVAIVLSILWYRRRQRRQQTDPGGTKSPIASAIVSELEEAASTKQQLEAAALLLQQQQPQPPKQQLQPQPLLKQQPIPEEEEEDDEEELRIVQEEHQRLLLAEQQQQQITPSLPLSPVAEEAREEVVEDKSKEEEQISSSVQAAEPEAAVTVEAPVAASPPKKGKKQAKKMVATEQKQQPPQQQQQPQQPQTQDQVVEQIAEVMAKISVDVQQTQPQPRDSANNSPAEAMLASPTISHDSDTHSVGSNDSGKGGSDVTTPVLEEEGGEKSKRSPRTGSRRTSTSSATASTSSEQAESAAAVTAAEGEKQVAVVPAAPSQVVVYEFAIPLPLVGKLIGKHGCFVAQIKTETRSQIQLKRHPDQYKYKLCSLEGTQAEIDKALKLIRKKFPLKKYPHLTLECISAPALHYPLIPESLQMYLVEGINNDVILSSLVSAGHMFFQTPTHPSFPVLSRLIMTMSQCYTEEETPTLPSPGPGVVCAAPSQGSWYRAEVIDVRTASPDEGMPADEVVCDIKFVDYGGYMTLPVSSLRQIRTDFMMLPFQATECYLADIIWLDGEDCWSVEATQCVESLTREQVMQAQVVAYADNGVPYVRLFSPLQMPPVMVNEVLVQEGLAKYYTC